MAKRGRPGIHRDAILAALATCTEPMGATYAWLLTATGIDRMPLKATLYKMALAGAIFASPRFKNSTYFLTAEARDAGEPIAVAHFAALSAQVKAAALDRIRERDRARSKVRTAKLAAARPPRQPKPPKIKAPKPPKPPKAAKDKSRARTKVFGHRSRKALKEPLAKCMRPDLPVITPPGVKPVLYPGCPTRTRYQPEPGFTGAWLKLGVGRYLEVAA